MLFNITNKRLNKVETFFTKESLNKSKDYILKHKKLSSCLAGAITLFSYAPFSFWIFMFLGFIILNLLLNNEKNSRTRLLMVLIFTYSFNVTNLYWVGNSFLYSSPEPWLVYVMPFLILAMGFLLTTPYLVIFYLLDKIKIKATYKSILLVPIVFVFVEYLRSLTVYGFPWDLVGYSIAGNSYLLQISELGSIIYVSFLILLMSSLIATMQQKYIRTAFVIFACWIVIGGFRYEYLESKRRAPEILQKTEIIQQDKPEHHKFNKDKMRKQVLYYLEGLREVKSQKEKPKLIVFPEMSIPYPIEKTPNLMKIFQDSLDEGDVLVLGSPAFDGDKIYNSLFYVTKENYKRYDKKLRVPFGEFIPFREVFSMIKNFTNNYKDFSIGDKANMVEIKGQKYLSLICYEVIFPTFVKDQLKGEKDAILVNLTNDAWFYGTVAPYQHALIAKTRAVENGVPLVRAANTGISYVTY